ncbi:MAG: hypothetical protein FD160_2429 [Caulobacteraceae bacterium]|nr:MAG: hypothetical protein FD160_2429 [Caulobacteraceae bacterium]
MGFANLAAKHSPKCKARCKNDERFIPNWVRRSTVAAPDGRVSFMIAGSQGYADACIVRLSHGSRLPGGPGSQEHDVETGAIGDIHCEHQIADIDSYAIAPDHPAFAAANWTVRLFVRPTFLRGPEALFDKGDIRLGLDERGQPVAFAAGEVTLSGKALRRGKWAGLTSNVLQGFLTRDFTHQETP